VSESTRARMMMSKTTRRHEIKMIIFTLRALCSLSSRTVDGRVVAGTATSQLELRERNGVGMKMEWRVSKPLLLGHKQR